MQNRQASPQPNSRIGSRSPPSSRRAVLSPPDSTASRRISPDSTARRRSASPQRSPTSSRSSLSRPDLKDEYYWYQRVVQLYGPEIQYLDHVKWEAVYHLLYPVYNLRNPFTAEVLENPDAVTILLQAGYDPSRGDNWPIQLAATRGYTETVRLLLKDSRVDPEGTLVMATENGHTDIVALLLEDGRVSREEIRQAREVAADLSDGSIADLLDR